jgi:hypothetical protein
MKETHYEIVLARRYYGPHATGSVLLRNGYPEYHAETHEVKESHKKYLEHFKTMEENI